MIHELTMSERVSAFQDRTFFFTESSRLAHDRSHHENPDPNTHTHTRGTERPRVAAGLCSLALLLSSGFCLAAPCPEDEEPDESNSPREWLAPEYQPRAYDADDETILRRRRFNPSNYDPNSSYPMVISIPATVFRQGDCDGTPKQRVATKDLTAAGYLVFQVEHRLAPNGLKAVVSLSGPTNLPSREGNTPDIILHFELSVENYTNARDGIDPDWSDIQYNASPIKLVANATYLPPIRMYATDGDSVPYQQGEDMRDALFLRGADVLFYKINDGSLHAFNYWHEINDLTTECVSAEVIDFLQAHL